MESPIAKNKSIVWDLFEPGLLEYSDGLKMQEDLWNKAKNGGNHSLILLEHEPVITMGRRTDPEHLLLTAEELLNKGIKLYKANRGGSATYHGPGQLVGYIICKSSRYGGIHNVVKMTLEVVNKVIRNYNIDSMIDFDNPGIWTNSEPPRKLSAVGMSNKEGYTMHGFAINVDLPLTGFSAIVPCGLQLPVTTLSIEAGKRFTVAEVKSQIMVELQNKFKMKISK